MRARPGGTTGAIDRGARGRGAVRTSLARQEDPCTRRRPARLASSPPPSGSASPPASRTPSARAPPRPKNFSLSRTGTALWNGTINPLFRELQVQCAADERNGWLGQLARLDADVAALADAKDRAAIAEYLTELRAWVVRLEAGAPGAGSWDDARAAIKAAAALAQAPLPTAVSTPTELQQAIDQGAALRATVERVSASAGYAENQLMNCGDLLGPQGDLLRQLQDRMNAVEALVLAEVTVIERDVLKPFTNLSRDLDGLATPSTWTTHAAWVGTAVEVLDRARAIIAAAPRYAQLATFTPPRKGVSTAPDFDGVVAAARQRVAELSPLVTQRLAEVAYPSDRAKDPARAKLVRAAAAGTLVNGPTFVAGTNPESWDEFDHGRTYRFKRETGWGYYVVKPATWAQPRPDGVADGALCELHMVNFQKYTAGGPSITKGRWYVNVDRYVTPILCANAKRISKLK
ncbi:MAG: hypothetical protein IPL61_30580 [Myxococcales bacterium]|nr:hypothetical protein [Myxococcales bacterium]